MRSSAGSIKKLGYNHYKVTVTYGFDPQTGRQRRRSKTIRGSKRDAENVRAQMMLTEDTGSIMTLGAFTEIYLADKKQSVRPDTYEGYVRASKKITQSKIAYMKLKDIEKNERAIREWLAAEDTQGGRSNAYKILRQVLQHAKRKHLINVCVTDFIDPPKLPTKEKATITTETLPAYLQAVHGLDIEAGVLLMLGCGLRRSEALGVKWSDITWSAGAGWFGTFEVVRGRYTRAGGGFYFDEPKTAKSRREILTPVWVGERLHEIYKERGGEYLYEVDGAVAQPQFFSRTWIKTLKANNLPIIQVKNLRHSCGTILVREAGANLTDVQQLLGHTSYRTTENYYVQKSTVSSARVAGAMSNIFDKG